MQSRTAQLLEFPKVLDLVAGHAASEAGAAACRDSRPLDDAVALGVATDLLSQWMDWALETGFALEGFPDLGGLFEHLDRPAEILDLDALWAVAEVLRLAGEARRILAEADPNRWPLLADTAAFLWPDRSASGLARCLNADGLLRDEASPELFSVRQEIRRIHRQCTGRVKEFLAGEDVAQYLQEEFMTISSDRYVLPLKANFKGRVKGIVHDYSQTGETCYIEPFFLVELNNQLQELKREEREAEKMVMAMLTGLLRSEAEAVRAAWDFLVAADVRMAKTRFARDMDARCVPSGKDLPLRLTGARHPLLASAARRGGSGAVPVDIVLEPGQQALVISGGNAGGKTVSLKTLGLAALMAASALPVAAEEGSSLPDWRRIVVILGDEQSLEQSLSTFTAQIRHLGRAMEIIDDNTLVIMDEFGAGTDPSQGAALAQAVVDELMERGAWIALATHFPALKAYALGREGIRAASVLFDPATRKPLYTLAYDQVGASQALDVAREHGMPERILERAGQYLLMDGSDTSRVLERLNALAVRREQETAELVAQRRRLEDKRSRLEERFATERQALLEEMRRASQDIVRQWQEGRKGRKEAMRELAQAREALAATGPASDTKSASESLEAAAIAPGMRVRHLPWGKAGTVLETGGRKGQIKVDLDGVSLWCDPGDLSLTGAQSDASTETAPARASGAVQAARVSSGAAVHLDLRGMRADAAESELARFLDKALLAGHREVEVIHGRGTGVLRREVHEFLRRFPAVERFELAPEDRGGDGMTIVELA